MDELTAALASSFEVSNIPNNPHAPHPRFSQYKVKRNVLDQQERRKKILEHQKKSRFDFLKHVRNLAEDTWDEEKTEDNNEDNMETQTTVRKPGLRYKDQLMLSEWMVDVPDNLASDWVMVPCPVGKRTLIVSSRGTTTAYAKNGVRVNRFPSLLPCGNRSVGYRNSDSCVLDCLFSEADRTYYVLDLMCWKGHPIYDSETDFRFYWSATKLKEIEKLDEISRINPFRFIALPNFACDGDTLSSAIACIPKPIQLQLDGVLFYHKKAHYTIGVTPLVVWLKPYMLPEMLNVSVPDVMLALKPTDYTNIVCHVEQWKQDEEERIQRRKYKQQLRHQRWKKRQEGMDVSTENANKEESIEEDCCEGESAKTVSLTENKESKTDIESIAENGESVN